MPKKLLDNKGWEKMYVWHKPKYNMVLKNIITSEILWSQISQKKSKKKNLFLSKHVFR